MGTSLIHIHLLGQEISRHLAPGERTDLAVPGTKPLILDSSFDRADALELHRNGEPALRRDANIKEC